MKTKRMLIAAAAGLMLAGAAASHPPGMGMMGGWGGPGGWAGHGMMGGWGMGQGMMGGYAGPMMGGHGGPGMMGGYGGPGMMGGYGGPGMMGGYGGPGMMGRGMGSGMMGAYPGQGGWFAALDLTPEQRKQIAEIHRETSKAMWELMGKMHEQPEHPMALLFGPGALDEAAALKAFDAMAQTHKAMFELHLQARQRLEGVLTEEQRERLRRQ